MSEAVEEQKGVESKSRSKKRVEGDVSKGSSVPTSFDVFDLGFLYAVRLAGDEDSTENKEKLSRFLKNGLPSSSSQSVLNFTGIIDKLKQCAVAYNELKSKQWLQEVVAAAKQQEDFMKSEKQRERQKKKAENIKTKEVAAAVAQSSQNVTVLTHIIIHDVYKADLMKFGVDDFKQAALNAIAFFESNIDKETKARLVGDYFSMKKDLQNLTISDYFNYLKNLVSNYKQKEEVEESLQQLDFRENFKIITDLAQIISNGDSSTRVQYVNDFWDHLVNKPTRGYIREDIQLHRNVLRKIISEIADEAKLKNNQNEEFKTLFKQVKTQIDEFKHPQTVEEEVKQNENLAAQLKNLKEMAAESKTIETGVEEEKETSDIDAGYDEDMGQPSQEVQEQGLEETQEKDVQVAKAIHESLGDVYKSFYNVTQDKRFLEMMDRKDMKGPQFAIEFTNAFHGREFLSIENEEQFRRNITPIFLSCGLAAILIALRSVGIFSTTNIQNIITFFRTRNFTQNIYRAKDISQDMAILRVKDYVCKLKVEQKPFFSEQQLRFGDSEEDLKEFQKNYDLASNVLKKPEFKRLREESRQGLVSTQLFFEKTATANPTESEQGGTGGRRKANRSFSNRWKL